MLKTTRMSKISITGPTSQLDHTIRKLHDLGVLDIEDYNNQYENFELGTPQDHADQLSSTLIKLRAIKSKLPHVEHPSSQHTEVDGLDKLREKLISIDEQAEHYLQDIKDLKERKKKLKSRINRLQKLQKLGASLDDLVECESIEIFFGQVDNHNFQEQLPEGHYELLTAGKDTLLFVDTDLDAGTWLNNSGFSPYKLDDLHELSGKLEHRILDTREKLLETGQEIKQNREDLEKLAEDAQGYLEANENVLQEELDRAKAPLKFATSENAFIAEGWIPTETFDQLKQELEDETGERVHIQEEDADDETPPVQHNNPGPIDNFEPLTDLVSIPQYNEIDPSFMLFLTFPLLFGFMIGDAGYGLSSLLVFYAAYRMFPEAKNIWISLMYCSAATIFFGLIFGDAFGFIIFGQDSVLASLTGIELFRQIPVLFHRTHHLGQVFQISALIGLIHVNIGLLLGLYQETQHHGLGHALLEKGGWFLLEIGAAVWYFQGAMFGGSILLAGAVVLYLGEGIEGVVEIPSLLSNILSYLRIFGVSVAAISLAVVVNSLAQPLYQTGTILGLVLGTAVLMLGHFFNTFIKIMEGFLQGIRLHYVELFTKFYEGGGRRYSPFGSSA